MATIQQQSNIWAQMSYTPPRGPCSQKTSLVTTCACYRFMIHPLKAASSFDCDGCGHHASFHRMESKEDEEVARRWRTEEMDGARRGQDMDVRKSEFLRIDDVLGGGTKRRRIADKPEELVEVELVGGEVERPAAAGRKRKGRGA